MLSVKSSGRVILCPLEDDSVQMVLKETRPHQPARGYRGEHVLVTKCVYICPECKSEVIVSYREDGRVGDLRQALDASSDKKLIL